ARLPAATSAALVSWLTWPRYQWKKTARPEPIAAAAHVTRARESANGWARLPVRGFAGPPVAGAGARGGRGPGAVPSPANPPPTTGMVSTIVSPEGRTSNADLHPGHRTLAPGGMTLVVRDFSAQCGHSGRTVSGMFAALQWVNQVGEAWRR